MSKQGEPFRARAYQKAQETLMAYPDDIYTTSQLKGKPGSNIEFVSINKRFMNVSIIDRAKHRKFYARMKDKDANLELLAEYHMSHTITNKGAKLLWEYYYNKYLN